MDEVGVWPLTELVDHPHLLVQSSDSIVARLGTLLAEIWSLDRRAAGNIPVLDQEFDDIGEVLTDPQVGVRSILDTVLDVSK